MPLLNQVLRILQFKMKSLVFALCLCALSVTLMAQTHDVLTLNDLKYDNDSKLYSVDGKDPFFIFTPTVDTNNSSETQYLIIDLELNQDSTPVQIFFNSQNTGFDPQHLIEFQAPNSTFALKVPKQISFEDASLRLDIEQCPNCQFSFKGAQLTDQAGINVIIEPTLLKNGSTTVSNGQDYEIERGLWLLNDLEGDINQFNTSGEDPFISTSALDVSTKNLGGLYLKFARPYSLQHDDFQIFYATENHPFTEKYSSIIRLKPNNVNNGQKQIIEMMVPLDYLDLETPKDHILKRIRLDLPIAEGDWSLISSKLIHFEQLGDYGSIIPAKMIQKKRQRLSGKALIKKVINNVWSDKAFSLAFVTLLLLVSGLFYRSFRK